MFTVTEAARDRLASKLERRNAAEGKALRLTRRKGGWKLRLDHAQPDDTAFAHDGKNVLLLDKSVSDQMTDRTLDMQDTGTGPRLRLRRSPRQKG